MREGVQSWLLGTRAVFRGYDRRLWVLYGGFIASAMGFAMIVPFVSLYFHEELGVSMSLVGTFFLVTAVVRAAFQGYAGDLSDRVGRVRIMVWGQAARALCFAVMALAVYRHLNFWAASSILVVSYVAGAFYQPVAYAAVNDLAPPEKRLEAYALMRMAHNLGWGVGPMLGGVVAEVGYAWLFLLGAITSLFSAWLVRRFVPETMAASRPTDFARAVPADDPPRRRRPQWMDIFEIRHDRRFLLFCGLSLLIFVTMSQWLSTLAVDAADRLHVTTAQLGVMFGLNGFMVVTLQLVVTRSLRRLRLPSALVLGSLVYAGAFFMVAFTGTYWHLLMIMAALTLGELIVSPPSIALVSLLAPPDRVGRYMGVHGLTASFGWSAGPFIGGVLYDRWSGSPAILWSAIASIGLLAALGFWLARHTLPSGGITPRTGTP